MSSQQDLSEDQYMQEGTFDYEIISDEEMIKSQSS
jgi:hypothetical protein